MEKSLKSSEWAVLCSFLLVFASLALFARLKSNKISSLVSSESFASQLPVSITIHGAVSKPGVYLAPAGTALEKIIKKSRPKKNADLSFFDSTQKVEVPLELTIHELQKICVFVSDGKNAPYEIQLPVGSRVCDLKSKIEVELAGSFNPFTSRRLLRNGEEISLVEKKD